MKVAIFFGSKSDTDKMAAAAKVLSEFGVEHEAHCVSAHRAGGLLRKKVAEAEQGGCEVIVAGAGLAAALPGVIAGITTLPVIGVPLEGAPAGLGGVDALLSIVQMPPQIPVATVGVGNAKNAAYLAVEILAVKYPELRGKLLEFRKKLERDAEDGERVLLLP